MTREEAIEILKDLWRTKHSTYLEADIRKALEMAIQALQAQADGDNVFKMRDATPEERESIDKYIKGISKPTGIEFDKEQEPKTAQWIHTEECDEEWQYRCSKCNMPSKSSSHRYCSNCGSYMYGLRGEQHG